MAELGAHAFLIDAVEKPERKHEGEGSFTDTEHPKVLDFPEWAFLSGESAHVFAERPLTAE